VWRNPNNLGYRRTVATARERDRCRERLTRLCESSLDAEAIQRETITELRRVIGFDRWCWPLADPQTLIPLSGVAEHDYGPGVARSLELEYSGADFATMGALARRTVPVGSLSGETGCDLACSPRWDEILRPVGIGDEAVLACRDALGCWGWIKVYRDRGDPAFSGDDLELLAAVGPSLGSALRRRIDGAAPDVHGSPSAPGVIVLDRDLRAVSWSAGAHDWAAALPGASVFAAWGMLPAAVYPAAALARSGRGANETHALERAVGGRWVKIEAAPLDGEDGGRIAVVLRGAAPAETFELFSRAYALTMRERQVVAALIAGDDTRAMTHRLAISRHTVQDHLKSVFAKVGVRSRRELLARFSGAGREDIDNTSVTHAGAAP
jgi:DNA-binding CsgD family transcriptional regulator